MTVFIAKGKLSVETETTLNHLIEKLYPMILNGLNVNVNSLKNLPGQITMTEKQGGCYR